MDVVDHERETCASGDVCEQIDDGFEEQMLPALRRRVSSASVASCGINRPSWARHAPRQFVDELGSGGVDQPPQRFGPRRVRHRFYAAPARHERALGSGRELGQQPGLADADLTADEDERAGGFLHLFERVEEVAERRLPTDEMRSALPGPHDSPIVRERLRFRHGRHESHSGW